MKINLNSEPISHDSAPISKRDINSSTVTQVTNVKHYNEYAALRK